MINLANLFPNRSIDLSNPLTDLSVKLKTTKPNHEQFLYSYHVESATSYLRARWSAYFSYNQAYNVYSDYINKKNNTLDKKLLDHFLTSFIITARTSLDLLLSMTHTLIENKPIKNIYPGFNDRKLRFKEDDIKNLIALTKQKDWFKHLDQSRNKIVHRGYHIGTRQIVKNHALSIEILLEKQNVTFVNTPRLHLAGLDLFEGFSIGHSSSPDSFDLSSIIQSYCFRFPELENEIFEIIIGHNNEYNFALKDLKKYEFKNISVFKF